MNVSCPDCRTIYRVDPRKVPSTGVRARCARCPGEFTVGDGNDIDAPERLSSEASYGGLVAGATTALGSVSEDPTRQVTGESPARPGGYDSESGHPPSFSGSEAWRGSEESDGGSGITYGRVEVDAGPESAGEPHGDGQPEETAGATPAVEPASEAAEEAQGYAAADARSEPGTDSETDAVDRAERETARAEAPPADEADVRPADESEPARSHADAVAPDPSVSGAAATTEADEADSPADPHTAAVPAAAARPPRDGGQDLVTVEAHESQVAGREGFSAVPARSDGEISLPPPVFGSSDPHARAQRLARALVSDIVVYHPDRRQKSLQRGTIRQEFREEIRKSWEEYVAQVGNQMARDTSYFRDALNELLAGGARLF